MVYRLLLLILVMFVYLQKLCYIGSFSYHSLNTTYYPSLNFVKITMSMLFFFYKILSILGPMEWIDDSDW
ncbi:hypothetical protein Pint_18178 [Pistacia integerrima]|uniref:Uncharacterized protein n=1 Tax=Pistacia integerrima TaxID=434235 RepID=A0ACC0YX77_9ROSI|nr:hypothetical protein Pint_18178 [Pistacia integerrima]